MARICKIVFATTGSYGDLHPVLAVAVELMERGHSVTVATDRAYRERVESSGVIFAPLRPGMDDFGMSPELFRKVNDSVHGSEFIVRTLVLPWLKESAADLIKAAEGADLLVSHSITYAAPLVAEKLKLKWAATSLQPIVFLSAYDPPVIAQAKWLERFRFLGPHFHRFLYGLVNVAVSRWMKPVHELCKEWGLPASRKNPLFAGQFSPYLNLALFSETFAAPQSDWPLNCVATGFPFFKERPMPADDASRLERFLSSGPSPVVFTLGTTAVNDAGSFYTESLAAVKALGVRAILLIGDDPRNQIAGELPEGVVTFSYIPFGAVLSRAKLTVHQGGVGTTAQALRSGRPQIVVPFANDQPDNAARVARLGVGLTIARKEFSRTSLEKTLRTVMESPKIEEAAARIGAIIQGEDGSGAAADAIEIFLGVKS